MCGWCALYDLVVCYLLCVESVVLRVVYCVLFAACWSLHVVWCLLFCYVLCGVCYLLSGV